MIVLKQMLSESGCAAWWVECWMNIAVFSRFTECPPNTRFGENVPERNSTHDFLIKNERLENKAVVFVVKSDVDICEMEISAQLRQNADSE